MPDPRNSDVTADITRRRAMGLMAAAPTFLSERTSAAAAAVDETGFVRIGGIDQWVGIQGGDARNPAILYLHGGPGEAQSPFLKEFVPWETDFTVVNWDQRGSGRTYGKYGPATPGMSTPEMALERVCEDVAEVRAPETAFIPIAGGRWACFTNATAFVEALRQHVRPLAAR